MACNRIKFSFTKESFKHSIYTWSWARKKVSRSARKKKVFKTTTKFLSFHSLFHLWIKIYDSRMRFSPCFVCADCWRKEDLHSSAKARWDRKAIKIKTHFLVFRNFSRIFFCSFLPIWKQAKDKFLLMCTYHFLIELCFPIICFLNGKLFAFSARSNYWKRRKSVLKV